MKLYKVEATNTKKIVFLVRLYNFFIKFHNLFGKVKIGTQK